MRSTGNNGGDSETQFAVILKQSVQGLEAQVPLSEKARCMAPTSILSAEAGGYQSGLHHGMLSLEKTKQGARRDESLDNMIPQNEALSVNPQHSQKAQCCDLHL